MANDSWRRARGRFKRSRGPLKPEAYESVPAAVLEPKQSGRKYRYADLQGIERIDMLRQVRDCAMAAMTHFEIAQQFGVAERTLTEWMMRDPEFAIALRLPKELADERVEKALYQRAVGYQFKAEEIKITDSGQVHRVEVIKQVPPDVGAAIFWLKNRKPHVWREKIDVAATVAGQIDVNHKADDPRALAMAVMDTIQEALYARLPPTIEGETVAKKQLSEYTDEELDALSPAEIEQLFSEADEDLEP